MATLRATIDSSGALVGSRLFIGAINQMRLAVLGLGTGTQAYATQLEKLQAQLAGVRNLSLGLFAGYEVIRLFRDARDAVAQFDQQLRNLSAVGGVDLGSKQFAELREAALQMAADTRYSTNEILGGFTELTKAGLDLQQSMQAIQAVLNLATIGQVDLGRATDVVVSTLSQFGLEAGEAARVADVLSLTANKTITDVNKLGEAFRVVGPIGANLGLSLEEVAAILGVIAQAGTQASLAGTQLRSVFASLATPTDKAAEKLAKFNIDAKKLDELFSEAGEEVFKRLASGALSTAEAFEVFDNRGATVALSASRMVDQITQLITELQNASGTAQKTADEMNKGLVAELQRAANAAGALYLRIASDSGVTGALRAVAINARETAVAIASNQTAVAALGSTAQFLAISIGSVVSIKIAAWLVEIARQATATTYTINALTGSYVRVTFLEQAMNRLRLAFTAAPITSWATAIGIAGAALVAFGDDIITRTDDLERFKNTIVSFQGIGEQFERGLQIQKEGIDANDVRKQVEGVETSIRAIEEALLQGRIRIAQAQKGVTEGIPAFKISELKGVLNTDELDRLGEDLRARLKQSVAEALATSEFGELPEIPLAQFFEDASLKIAGITIADGAVEEALRKLVQDVNPDLDALFKDLKPVALPVDDTTLQVLEDRVKALREIEAKLRAQPVDTTVVKAPPPPSTEFLEESRRLSEEAIRINVELADSFDAQRKAVLAASVAYFQLNEQRVTDGDLSQDEADKLNAQEFAVQQLRIKLLELKEAKDQLASTRAFEDEESRLIRDAISRQGELSDKYTAQIQVLDLNHEAFTRLQERRVEDGERTREQADNLIRLNAQLTEQEKAILAVARAKDETSAERSLQDEDSKLNTQLLQLRAQRLGTFEAEKAVIDDWVKSYEIAIDRQLEDGEIGKDVAETRKNIVRAIGEESAALAKLRIAQEQEQEGYREFVKNNRFRLGVARDSLQQFSQAIGQAAAGFGEFSEIANRALRGVIANLVAAAAEALLFKTVISPIFTAAGASQSFVDQFFGFSSGSAAGNVVASARGNVVNAGGPVLVRTFATGSPITNNSTSSSSVSNIRTTPTNVISVRAFAAGAPITRGAPMEVRSSTSSTASRERVSSAVAVTNNRDKIREFALGAPFVSVTAFARGASPFLNTIVNKPTYFNLGLMGERDPEAISPLRKGSTGLGYYGFVNGKDVATIPYTRGNNGMLGVDLARISYHDTKAVRAFAAGTVINRDESRIYDSRTTSIGFRESNPVAFKVPENLAFVAPTSFASTTTNTGPTTRSIEQNDNRVYNNNFNFRSSDPSGRGSRKTSRQIADEIRRIR